LEFLHLNAFFLLIFPLVLFLFLLLKKQNSFTSHFSREVLDKITISDNSMSKNVKNTLLILSLILFIIAIARPIMQKKEQEIKEDLIPIIVAIDVSKSMLANDIYPNRLSLAKQKLLKIIQNSKQSAIGVVLFAKSAFVLSPVTRDFTSLIFLVDNLDTGLNFDNGSNVLSMLEASNDLLESYNSKNIILLSDGGNKENYEKEINFANDNNIKIYAIGLASNKQSPIPIKDGYLTDDSGKIVTVGLNKNIAKLGLKSHGGYIDFSLNSNDINEILKDISNEAKKEHMNNTKIKAYEEFFYYPIGLALLLLFVCFSSFSRKKAHLLFLTLIFSGFSTQHLHADIFDFQTLKKAKESYIKKEFKTAEEFYKKVDKNAQSKYNLANSMYNQGKYKEALETYKDVKTNDKQLEYKTLHNIGNTYVKQNNLEKAQKAYEDALKLQEDKQTKQNLETVKKALKKQKKQDKKDNKNNKKNDKNKEKKDSKQNKEDKKNKDKKQSDKDKKDKKDKKQKDSKKDKDKDSKNDKAKQQENKKKKEEDKQKKKNKEASKQEQSDQDKNKKIISDMEEKKWLNKLKQQKNKTFLRKYDTKSSEDNVKNPW